MARIYKIKSGAIFLSDAHANTNRANFRAFLQELNSLENENLPSQIFMLGDMFDFLANTTYSQKFYEFEINLINEISKKCEIFYFEGNHDFNLAEIFSGVKVFANKEQPVSFKSDMDEILQISHGDIFLPKQTQTTLLFLRNKIFLKIANALDTMLNYAITKAILNAQSKKNLDRKAENFANFIEPKIHNYTAKIVVEGHYHQDSVLEFGKKIYINLACFGVKPKIYKFDDKTSKFDEFCLNLNLK
ncbi:MAG: metallophosphoesterase [Campylobacter sp.]|nr:metallophosphoesterase [Campylobacter sp.]